MSVDRTSAQLRMGRMSSSLGPHPFFSTEVEGNAVISGVGLVYLFLCALQSARVVLPPAELPWVSAG